MEGNNTEAQSVTQTHHRGTEKNTVTFPAPLCGSVVLVGLSYGAFCASVITGGK